MLYDQHDRLAEQALQQMGHLRHHIGKLEHLRAQGLLSREGKKLSSKARSAVRVRLDLLDVVIIDVARRVPHQHQVTMSDDRGEDVVEVVSDAAGELTDDLHLRRLRDLPFELGFLAIVLEKKEDRCVAKPAEARDRQRHRFGRQLDEAHGDIPGHRRTTGIPSHRIGDRGFVFLDDEIAGIGRHFRTGDPGGVTERLVHGQEAAVAVHQREPDGKHVEQ